MEEKDQLAQVAMALVKTVLVEMALVETVQEAEMEADATVLEVETGGAVALHVVSKDLVEDLELDDHGGEEIAAKHPQLEVVQVGEVDHEVEAMSVSADSFLLSVIFLFQFQFLSTVESSQLMAVLFPVVLLLLWVLMVARHILVVLGARISALVYQSTVPLEVSM